MANTLSRMRVAVLGAGKIGGILLQGSLRDAACCVSTINDPMYVWAIKELLYGSQIRESA